MQRTPAVAHAVRIFSLTTAAYGCVASITSNWLDSGHRSACLHCSADFSDSDFSSSPSVSSVMGFNSCRAVSSDVKPVACLAASNSAVISSASSRPTCTVIPGPVGSKLAPYAVVTYTSAAIGSPEDSCAAHAATSSCAAHSLFTSTIASAIFRPSVVPPNRNICISFTRASAHTREGSPCAGRPASR